MDTGQASSTSRKAWVWAVAAGASILLLSGIGIALASSDDPGSATDATPTSSPTVDVTTVTTSPTTSEVDAAEQLMAMMPAGVGDCSSEPPAQGIATTSCATSDGQYRSRFTLFESQSALDAYYDSTVPKDIRSTTSDCSGTGAQGSNTWEYNGQEGRVSCYFETENNFSAITWTESGALVCGQIYGPSGELGPTWELWSDLDTFG